MITKVTYPYNSYQIVIPNSNTWDVVFWVKIFNQQLNVLLFHHVTPSVISIYCPCCMEHN